MYCNICIAEHVISGTWLFPNCFLGLKELLQTFACFRSGTAVHLESSYSSYMDFMALVALTSNIKHQLAGEQNRSSSDVGQRCERSLLDLSRAGDLWDSWAHRAAAWAGSKSGEVGGAGSCPNLWYLYRAHMGDGLNKAQADPLCHPESLPFHTQKHKVSFHAMRWVTRVCKMVQLWQNDNLGFSCEIFSAFPSLISHKCVKRWGNLVFIGNKIGIGLAVVGSQIACTNFLLSQFTPHVRIDGYPSLLCTSTFQLSTKNTSYLMA